MWTNLIHLVLNAVSQFAHNDAWANLRKIHSLLTRGNSWEKFWPFWRWSQWQPAAIYRLTVRRPAKSTIQMLFIPISIKQVPWRGVSSLASRHWSNIVQLTFLRVIKSSCKIRTVVLKKRWLNKCRNFCGKINGTKALILLIPASHSCAGSP